MPWLPVRRPRTSYTGKTRSCPRGRILRSSGVGSIVSGDPPPLAFADTLEILKQLADQRVVLVGGQALNYWCDLYSARVPELAAVRPFTSKDVDFHGKADAARALARRIGGHARIPKFDDATPNSGVVTFKDTAGWERLVDFLKFVGGISDDEKLYRAGIPVPVAEGVEIRVMNPIFCLESRAYNVIHLPESYDNEHGLKQLRLSVMCAREFIRDAVDKRRALDLNERVFDFCRSRLGVEVFVKKNVDAFAAVEPNHPLVPETFRARRYPQMRTILNAIRAKASGGPS